MRRKDEKLHGVANENLILDWFILQGQKIKRLIFDSNVKKKIELINHENNTNNSSFDDLIKMKEAMRLLQTSAPTVRKYARLGRYQQYRMGEKLTYYRKSEILEYIMKKQDKDERK